MPDPPESKPCHRCKAPDAPLTLRNSSTCRDCYVDYVNTKVARRLAVLHRETRASVQPAPRRYLAGLSLGASSGVLVHTLNETVKYHAARRASAAFEPLAVHVDTSLGVPGRPSAAAGHGAATSRAQALLDEYRRRYPSISFRCVHLKEVMDVRTVDWSALPVAEGADALERLRSLFDKLPSATSRADVLRLLIRHLLLHLAMEESYSVLLLGHSTTALAALTLSEVANGRGFAVPWQVNDGDHTVCTYVRDPDSITKEVARTTMPIYYPLREVLRREIATYVELTPSLGELVVPADDTLTRAVVSHKDLSIAEVMKRYFEGVEGPHAGIIANVVRTAGKLNRAEADRQCGVCGSAVDEPGDSRWAGEVGDQPLESPEPGQGGGLCYGCKRSITG